MGKGKMLVARNALRVCAGIAAAVVMLCALTLGAGGTAWADDDGNIASGNFGAVDENGD